MKKMTIPYGRQTVTRDDIEAVVKVLESDYLTQGPLLDDFENMVAEYHGAKYGVAFANGTAALHAAYYASEIDDGDEIITSPITFVSSANGALFLGARPVFADIDMETYCINPDKIDDKITSKTKVITPVSLAGYPVDLAAIREVADRHNCIVIHDAAHAIGSKRNSTFGMEYADMAILSFHPVKHVTTGEGGMVLTNDKNFCERLKRFRTHGITKNINEMEKCDGPWYYEMQDLGYNYRLSEINIALGISQFSRIEQNLRRRNEIAQRYNDAFKNNDNLITPPGFSFDDHNNIHSYHLYPLRVKNDNSRRKLYDYLHENGVLAQIHYIPVTSQPYYVETFGTKTEEYPNAADYYNTELSIPMYHGMSDEEQEYVIDVINRFEW